MSVATTTAVTRIRERTSLCIFRAFGGLNAGQAFGPTVERRRAEMTSFQYRLALHALRC